VWLLPGPGSDHPTLQFIIAELGQLMATNRQQQLTAVLVGRPRHRNAPTHLVVVGISS